MNKINNLQNSEEILSALFAQRCLYSKAKRIDTIIFMLMIFNCVIANINCVKEMYVFIIVFTIAIINVIFHETKEKSINEAAEIQEYIDRKMYGFKINESIDNYSIEELKRKIKSINIKYEKKASVQKNATGDSKEHGVKDWYVDIKQNMKKNNAIYKCQTQNTWWDEKNSQTYVKINFVLFLAIFIVFVWALKTESYAFLIAMLEPFLYIFDFYRKNQKFADVSKEIKTLEERIDKDNIDIKDLEYIQEKIFKRRKIGYMVPDFIDKLKSIKLHRIYKE